MFYTYYNYVMQLGMGKFKKIIISVSHCSPNESIYFFSYLAHFLGAYIQLNWTDLRLKLRKIIKSNKMSRNSVPLALENWATTKNHIKNVTTSSGEGFHLFKLIYLKHIFTVIKIPFFYIHFLKRGARFVFTLM